MPLAQPLTQTGKATANQDQSVGIAVFFRDERFRLNPITGIGVTETPKFSLPFKVAVRFEQVSRAIRSNTTVGSSFRNGVSRR